VCYPWKIGRERVRGSGKPRVLSRSFWVSFTDWRARSVEERRKVTEVLDAVQEQDIWNGVLLIVPVRDTQADWLWTVSIVDTCEREGVLFGRNEGNYKH